MYIYPLLNDSKCHEKDYKCYKSDDPPLGYSKSFAR